MTDSGSHFLAQIKTAKQITIYQKQSLPKQVLKLLRDCMSGGLHSTIEIVVEDLSDAVYLRNLHSCGFALFYGVGLPRRSVILMDSRQGFVCDDNTGAAAFRSLSSKDAEDLYYKLRWCRFGHAVLLTGVVKETDTHRGLLCLASEGGREFWCRLKELKLSDIPEPGKTIEVFAWQKWLSHILEVFEIKKLEVQGYP
jgi:hypothetical protein